MSKADMMKAIIANIEKKSGKTFSKAVLPEVNVTRAERIADAYADMPHTPNDPKTKKAYDALISETKKQYEELVASGLVPEPASVGYKNSKEMAKDVVENNRLKYFPTEEGFGTGAAKVSDNPMYADSGVKIGDKSLKNNDLFRVVHDVYGHVPDSSSFGPRGEEAAYLRHKEMFSPEAQRALLSETRGQNSYVNYGPDAAHNKANPQATKYADQKIGLLPEHFNEAGAKTSFSPRMPKTDPTTTMAPSLGARIAAGVGSAAGKAFEGLQAVNDFTGQYADKIESAINTPDFKEKRAAMHAQIYPDLQVQAGDEDKKASNSLRNAIVQKIGLPDSWMQTEADQKRSFTELPEQMGLSAGAINTKPFGSVKVLEAAKAPLGTVKVLESAKVPVGGVKPNAAAEVAKRIPATSTPAADDIKSLFEPQRKTTL